MSGLLQSIKRTYRRSGSAWVWSLSYYNEFLEEGREPTKREAEKKAAEVHVRQSKRISEQLEAVKEYSKKDDEAKWQSNDFCFSDNFSPEAMRGRDLTKEEREQEVENILTSIEQKKKNEEII